ncbi:PIR protein [Plasmodium malariae]|uniref:PIR protein n=1 Tax=Plasmodium malariae TaxID=5858 RepID=A0A1D3JHJ3_PLAMA|nr:PIR protein [Plasmodium malariae]SBT85820.1 PIR protein [Plasmodium malariae]
MKVFAIYFSQYDKTYSINKNIFDIKNDILKQLPSYALYNKFNSEIKEVKYNNACKILDSVTSEYKDNCINLCKKVARNLENLPKKDKSWSYENRCSHYKYWLYEEIRKFFKDDAKPNDVEVVIKEFLRVQPLLTTDYEILNCDYKFSQKNLQELETKIEEKYMFDYFTNYEHIKAKETCVNVEIEKYKKYLNFILQLYNRKKGVCCVGKISKCPNYLLNCDNEFNPSKLLSKLGSSYDGNCNGLKSFTENKTSEKELESSDFEPDFLETFHFTNCNINNISPNLQCAFIQASGMTRRNQSSVGSSEQGNDDKLSLENKEFESRIKSEALVQHEEIRKRVGFEDQDKKNLLPLRKKGTDVDLRWKLGKDGTLHCPAEKSGEDTSGLCKYIEQLVGKGILVKIKNTGGYRLAEGKSWPTSELKIYVKKESQRQSMEMNTQKYIISELENVLKANQEGSSVTKKYNGKAFLGKEEETNILQNTFFRVVTVTVLFTPFGTYLGKTRKRKKRYRTNFSELSTQRLPRRFIKRTYRNSERRRFSVVNVEPRNSFH